MNINLPHILAAMAVIFVVAFAIEQSGLARDAGRGKRALITGGLVGAALLILNLLWPYVPA